MLYNLENIFGRFKRSASFNKEPRSPTSNKDSMRSRRSDSNKSCNQRGEIYPDDPEIPFLKEKSIRNKHKKTLVLDLDETLVHCKFEPLANYDFSYTYNYEGKTYSVCVLKRPGVDKFLDEMSKLYEIVVFTASVGEYCQPIIKFLDPDGVTISAVLDREHCSTQNRKHLKDLSRLGREMRDIIIIDNLASGFRRQPDNGILIKDFIGGSDDSELEKMIPFLNLCTKMNDIRPVGTRYKKFLLKEGFTYIDKKESTEVFPLISRQILNNWDEIDERIEEPRKPNRFPDKLKAHETRVSPRLFFKIEAETLEQQKELLLVAKNAGNESYGVNSKLFSHSETKYSTARSNQSIRFSKFATNQTNPYSPTQSYSKSEDNDCDSDIEEGTKNSIELNAFSLQLLAPLPGSKKKVKLGVSAKSNF